MNKALAANYQMEGSMDRKRSRSPFPSAYKVIADVEVNKTMTVPCPPSEELLEACKHRGVVCHGCGISDELGLDWAHTVIMDDEENRKDEWHCKLCLKADCAPQLYQYGAYKLDNAVDEPFKKKR